MGHAGWYWYHGDFNTRVQAAQPGEEGQIGKHTVCKESDTLRAQAEEVQDNRARFIEFLAAKTMVVANTLFQTPERHNATLLSNKEHGRRPPWTRPNHEAIY